MQFFKDLFKYTKRVYFTKALDFRSRASRKEYLYANPAHTFYSILLCSWVLGILSASLHSNPFYLLPALATTALGILSATIRRLNDCSTPKIISFTLKTVTIGAIPLLLIVTYLSRNLNFVWFVKSIINLPLVVLLAIIIVLTFLILIYYLTKPSTPGENKYGPQPEDQIVKGKFK